MEIPEIEPRVQLRLMTARLHDLRVPRRAIIQALKLSDATVTNYLKLYRDSGFRN
jgi:hypothetical protein